eukprot:m.269127 g.269127  ORF g.269127 m.269127 type:complete len:347 (+) comp16064_c0_seq14:2021-3061(+)
MRRKRLHPRKALSGITVTPFGMSISVRNRHRLNASVPISVKHCGNVMRWTFSHNRNAKQPIWRILDGRTTSWRCSQFSKHPSPTPVPLSSGTGAHRAIAAVYSRGSFTSSSRSKRCSVHAEGPFGAGKQITLSIAVLLKKYSRMECVSHGNTTVGPPAYRLALTGRSLGFEGGFTEAGFAEGTFGREDGRLRGFRRPYTPPDGFERGADATPGVKRAGAPNAALPPLAAPSAPLPPPNLKPPLPDDNDALARSCSAPTEFLSREAAAAAAPVVEAPRLFAPKEKVGCGTPVSSSVPLRSAGCRTPLEPNRKDVAAAGLVEGGHTGSGEGARGVGSWVLFGGASAMC